MGPNPSGPSFTVPSQEPAVPRFPVAPAALGPTGRPAATNPLRPGPATSRLPALITTLVVLLVCTVVAVSTVVADRRDRQVSPPPRVSRASAVPADANSIDFTSADGAGRLVVRGHAWTPADRALVPGLVHLKVQVELICTSGMISYDPYAFQAFDASGRLFELSEADAAADLLESGTLAEDERARGSLAFDLPRGDVTLLMTDEATQTVTALKILD